MSRSVHVLMVEDNPGDADLTRETLEQSKLRLSITLVEDGSEALAYLLKEPPFESAPTPDLLLLDLNLPKVDGRTVLERIRSTDALRSLPVVVLTSSDAEQDIARSYALGANCYVTKPVGLAEFQAIVRSVERFWFTIVRLP